MAIEVALHNRSTAAWDAYVAAAPESSCYHQFAWKEVIEKSFGHTGYYLSAHNEKGEIQGILPLIHMKSYLFGSFLVSVPFVNYGGLLCCSNKTEKALLDHAESLRSDLGADHIEFRHIGKCATELPTKEHKVTMVLQLQQDEEAQWKSFNAKLRNQVRKAEKNGLTVTIGHHELIDGFYEVFCRNMRDLGTPVYAKSFFKNVFAAFPDSTRVISVFYEGRVIASGIATWFRNTVEIPWASSNKDFKSLCPNNLLYWEAIRFAIGCGFEKFDFGRSTPGEGTYKFKEQWGAKPIPLSWQYLLKKDQQLPEMNPANPKYKMAIKIWQRLPLGITKVLGPAIVRNIP